MASSGAEGASGGANAVNELLRILTSSCKLSLSDALPIVSTLVKKGITTYVLVLFNFKED